MRWPHWRRRSSNGASGAPANLDEGARRVEAVLETLPELGRIVRDRGDETMAWETEFPPGQVQFFLTAPNGETTGYLQIIARLMEIPEGSALPLYRRLLDLNAGELVQCAFGLSGLHVVLTCECFWNELTPDHVDSLIRSVLAVITRHADAMVTEFGCRRVCDLPE